MFRNLFAAEWLKLRRWPVAWALLGAFLVLMLLALALWALVLALHAGLIGRSRLTALNAAQLTQIERQLSFPRHFWRSTRAHQRHRRAVRHLPRRWFTRR